MKHNATGFHRVCVITADQRLTDAYKPKGRFGEEDRRYYQTMRGALLSLADYEFEFLSDHSRMIPELLKVPPEFVLNFCDTGFRNVAAQELHLPALLEMLDIPYSGAPPACMALCYDKALVRMAADALKIPTPAEYCLEPDQDLEILETLTFPALIKPNTADGSLGITRDAMVTDASKARDYLTWMRTELPERAALVQEYLPGAEYGIGLIGNPGEGFRVLPPLAVDFDGLPQGLAPILAYESKTDPASPYWRSIQFRPAELDGDVLSKLIQSATRLFTRLQCRDYARFDFRTGGDGMIKLMEVNPNPAWDCDAKLAIMAGFAGMSYTEYLSAILDAAQRRLDQKSRRDTGSCQRRLFTSWSPS